MSRRDVFAFVTSLDAAEILAAGERPFALLGGTFHHSARSFVGALFNDTLVNIHPDKVVMSAKGYTPEAGFTDPHLAEAEAKILLRKSGATVIVLIDHTKIGRRSLMTVARTEDVHVLVTDEEPPQAVRLALERADVRLIVA